MHERKTKDDNNEKLSCKRQRSKGTVIFPAMLISNEIETIEDTTCIDTNRDELLKSFCSFTSDLDNLFAIQGMEKNARSFWPNICCKERRDTTLEVCKDPTGKINRTDIIPFALSQGGDYSRHNLYVEVTDTIKNNGTLHKGMKKLLETLGKNKTKHAKTLVDSFFNEVSLCGPRIIDAPDNKDSRKLCQLFIPYHHTMKRFYTLIEVFLQKLKGASTAKKTSFLELDIKGKPKQNVVDNLISNLKSHVKLFKNEIDTPMKHLEESIDKRSSQGKSSGNIGISENAVERIVDLAVGKATKGLKLELKHSKEQIAMLKGESKTAASTAETLKNQMTRLKGEVKSQAAAIVDEDITTLKTEINNELSDAVSNNTVKVQLAKRQKYRLGKGSIKSIGSILRSKPKTNSKRTTCTGGSSFGTNELADMKDTHCTGYKHLDLSSPEIKNIAMHYLNNDLSDKILNNSHHMNALATALRYDVQDTSCPSKLFEAKDISIQHVNMDTLGNEKEWVAVVNLNTQDTIGYLQSELPYCKARDYLIAAKAEIKVYIDEGGCCDGLKDYKQCVAKVTCKNKLSKLKVNNDKHYSKVVVLTGTQYKVKSSYDMNRRRRLLQEHAGSGC
jgi:hypothetical protein